jgi:membrane protease YdiL (CAAX protease family)
MGDGSSTVASGAGSPSAVTGRWRRLAEITAFVGIWVAIGELIDMNPNIYLLFGIPYVALFQLYVARRPLHELWVKGGPAFEPRRIPLAIALLLMVVPVIVLVVDLADDNGLPIYLWDVAAISGALPAAYALGLFTRETLRYLGLCLITAGPIGLFWLVGLQFLADTFFHLAPEPSFDPLTFVEYLFLYFPSLFMVEEVVFRGALDSHVQHPGESHGLLTAIFVSVLWGLWHYPIAGGESVVLLILVMGTTGIFLSIFWRRSGNLAVSGATHTFIDSVRNAFGNIP